MIDNLFTKVFGTKHAREVKRMAPLVEEINGFETGLQQLSDEELQAKTSWGQAAYGGPVRHLARLTPTGFSCMLWILAWACKQAPPRAGCLPPLRVTSWRRA